MIDSHVTTNNRDKHRRRSGLITGRKGNAMYNKFMEEKEINVKVGDRVIVEGNRGTVTEVFRSIDKEWNGKRYVEIPGSEYTNVRVHFNKDELLSTFGQYQDGVYGGYAVIE